MDDSSTQTYKWNEAEYKSHIETVVFTLGSYIGKKWELVETTDLLGCQVWHIRDCSTHQVKHAHAHYYLDEAIECFVQVEPFTEKPGV
jgi:hypothetical protein